MSSAIIFMFALLIVPGLPMSYPVFGTKRYHRGTNKAIIQPIPLQNNQLSPPIPPQYYDDSYLSSGSNYPNQYSGYPDDSNIYYYPPHQPQYQSYGLPTYRGDYKPTQYYYAHGPTYSYYDERSDTPNPLDDLHEEMLQEDERERQRELMPPNYYGQEMWFEKSPSRPNNDQLTNAFLNNLMLYNKQISDERKAEQRNYDFDEYTDSNGNPDYYEQTPGSMGTFDTKKYQPIVKNPMNHLSKNKPAELDKDVRDLKSLIKNEKLQSQRQNDQSTDWMNKDSGYEPSEPDYDDDTWINWDTKRSQYFARLPQNFEGLVELTDRKPTSLIEHYRKLTTKTPMVAATTITTTTKNPSNLDLNMNEIYPGQKEVVLPRPATPVRHPFSAPIMEMLTHNAVQDKRDVKNSQQSSPNVYETIKQLIAMEQSLENKSKDVKMQKRFVTNEQSLVQELDGLKRKTVD